MKKLFLFISLVFCFVIGQSQVIVNRAGAANTVRDYRLMAGNNFFMPAYQDTNAANAAKGIDSSGALIFIRSTKSVWYRQFSPKKWVEITSSSAGTVNITNITFNTDSSLIICYGNGTCDTVNVGGSPVNITNIYNNSVTNNNISIFQDSMLVICNGVGVCDTINAGFVINNYSFINDSTVVICDSLDLSGNPICDTFRFPPKPLFLGQNWINIPTPGIWEFGAPNDFGLDNGFYLYHTTYNTTGYYRMFWNQATIFNYGHQFQKTQHFGWQNGTGIVSFLHQDGLGGVNPDNITRYGINYQSSPYQIGVPAYFANSKGYFVGVNATGGGSFGLYYDDAKTKVDGLFYHVGDTATTYGVSIYARAPLNSGTYFSGMAAYYVAHFDTDGYVEFPQYGSGTKKQTGKYLLGVTTSGKIGEVDTVNLAGRGFRFSVNPIVGDHDSINSVRVAASDTQWANITAGRIQLSAPAYPDLHFYAHNRTGTSGNTEKAGFGYDTLQQARAGGGGHFYLDLRDSISNFVFESGGSPDHWFFTKYYSPATSLSVLGYSGRGKVLVYGSGAPDFTNPAIGDASLRKFNVYGTSYFSDSMFLASRRSGAATDSILTWDATTGEVKVLTPTRLSSLLGFPTLQQVFNTEVGGSVLTKIDTIKTTNTSYLKVIGTSLNGDLFVKNTTASGTATKISTTGSNGTGLFVDVTASSGGSALGVYSQSLDGAAGDFVATGTGYAMQLSTTNGGTGVLGSFTDGTPFNLLNIRSGTNDVSTFLSLKRTSSGTPADGIGLSIDFSIQPNGAGIQKLSNQIISKWSTAADASRTSQMLFTGINAAAGTTLLTLNGNKSIQFNGYGSGTFTGTAATVPQFDASGNVIETLSGGISSVQQYQPTLTSVTNVSASTSYTTTNYQRIGDHVTVWGKLQVDPTAGGAVELGISLPIASAFSSDDACTGSGGSTNITGENLVILADVANGRATLKFVATDVTNRTVYFTFSYKYSAP